MNDTPARAIITPPDYPVRVHFDQIEIFSMNQQIPIHTGQVLKKNSSSV